VAAPTTSISARRAPAAARIAGCLQQRRAASWNRAIRIFGAEGFTTMWPLSVSCSTAQLALVVLCAARVRRSVCLYCDRVNHHRNQQQLISASFQSVPITPPAAPAARTFAAAGPPECATWRAGPCQSFMMADISLPVEWDSKNSLLPHHLVENRLRRLVTAETDVVDQIVRAIIAQPCHNTPSWRTHDVEYIVEVGGTIWSR